VFLAVYRVVDKVQGIGRPNLETEETDSMGCNRFGYNLDLIDLTLFFPKNHCFS